MFPPRHVMAAVDFSEGSRAALRFATRLARHGGATFRVLHAEDPRLPEIGRAAGHDIVREAQEELTAFVQAIEPERPSSHRLHVVTGHPTDVICDVARREHVDLIVMGLRGLSSTERLAFGSTTEGVLRRTDVSVLVVPQAWQAPQRDGVDLAGVGPVVVGVDLSTPSLEATRAACRLATLLGTTVDAVHVVPAVSVLERWRPQAEIVERQHMDTAHRDLSAAVRNASAGVTIQLQIHRGSIAPTLVDAVAAHTSRHPVLVLGRRTHTDRSGAPGSTAYRVLTLTHTPVLLHV